MKIRCYFLVFHFFSFGLAIATEDKLLISIVEWHWHGLVTLKLEFGFWTLPCEAQPWTGPGWPLIVWALETFGAKPDFKASFITASVSDFHHSPKPNSNIVRTMEHDFYSITQWIKVQRKIFIIFFLLLMTIEPQSEIIQQHKKKSSRTYSIS